MTPVAQRQGPRMSAFVGTAPLAVAALVLAGCAAPPGVVPPQDAEGRYVIRMTGNLTFEPAEARVPLGATVVWANVGPAPHDVNGYVGDPPTEDHPRFASSAGGGPLIPPGGEYSAVLDERGAWTVWCHTHHEQRMKGIVHVG